MSTFAPFSGILVPGESDPPSVDGNAFFTANPGIIDQFLKIGAVTHRHDGHLPLADPSTVLSGSVAWTGGALPPDTTFYSTFTLIDQYGGETLPASAFALTTSAGVGAPTGFVTASADYTDGILPAGDYYYAKTFVDGAGGETPIGPSTLIYVDPGFASAQVHIGNLMADAPPGATAARLWRSYEGEDWHLTVQTASDTYLDAGFDPPDNPALPPTTDSTNQTGELLLTIPSDPAMTSACAAINLYLSSDPAFGSPSLYDQYPTASAGATITVTSETTTAGEPPHVSRASRGAAQINPDTDILNWPWKRSAATFSALPATGNSNGDTRIVLDELGSYTWSASAGVWDHTGDGDTGGSGGSSASIILTDGTTSVVVTGSILVEGSGAASATVVDDGGGHATLIVYVPVDSDSDSDTGGGGGGASASVSDQTSDTFAFTTLQIIGSGGVTTEAVDDGSGHITLTISPPTDTDPASAPLVEVVNVVAAAGSAQTIPNPDTYGENLLTLDSATCALTFPTASAGKSFILALVQDGTGSRLATWPTVKWAGGGVAPTLTTTASKTDLFSFICIDGANWIGLIAGQNI